MQYKPSKGTLFRVVFATVLIGLVVTYYHVYRSGILDVQNSYPNPRQPYALWIKAQGHTKKTRPPPISKKTSLEVFTSDELPNSIWAPLMIDKCKPGNMPSYTAPCLVEQPSQQGNSHVSYGQELMFPEFKIRLPGYLNEEHRQFFVSGTLNKGDFGRGILREDDWVHYDAQRGQNLVLSNAVYTGHPEPDRWNAEACMERTTSHKAFFDASHVKHALTEGSPQYEQMTIIASPDSWSFQHFLDRVTHVIIQMKLLPHFHNQSTTFIAGRRPSNSIVSEMWSLLIKELHHKSPTAPDDNKVLYSYDIDPPIFAKKLLFSCRSPLIHPWHFQILAQLLRNTMPEPKRKVLSVEKRKKIVLALRRGDSRMLNGGRAVLNADELIARLTVFLEERNLGEFIVEFDSKKHGGSIASAMETFGDAAALIGPHGGALYNQVFLPSDSLVVELINDRFGGLMFWEQSSLLNHNYWILPHQAERANNINVNINDLLEILQRNLGKVREKKVLEMEYPWQV